MRDYHTKAFSTKNMKRLRGLYIHTKDSPIFLMRVQLPHAQQGDTNPVLITQGNLVFDMCNPRMRTIKPCVHNSKG